MHLHIYTDADGTNVRLKALGCETKYVLGAECHINLEHPALGLNWQGTVEELAQLLAYDARDRAARRARNLAEAD